MTSLRVIGVLAPSPQPKILATPLTVKDTFEFLHRLHNISIDNKIMGSFDVKSLFTNITVDFTINLILENIFINGVKDFKGLSKLQLNKLLHWTTKGTVFQSQGKLYKQTDGVAWAVRLLHYWRMFA